MKFIPLIRPAFVFWMVASCLKWSTISAAPITFNTALPLSQGQGIARALLSYEESRNESDQASLERERLSVTSVLGYGINAKWAAFAVLPVSNIELTSNTQESGETALGDVELFSRYEVWRADGSATTQRLAPFLGVRLPSGETGLTSDGTTDFFAGFVFTSARTKRNFDLQLRFDLNGSRNGFNVGNRISFDASWQQRIAPSITSASTKGFWFAALEVNAYYTKRAKLLGEINPNSGGLTSSIAPGIQFITRRWIAELAVRFPVISNLNGDAIESDFTVFTGLRANF